MSFSLRYPLLVACFGFCVTAQMVVAEPASFPWPEDLEGRSVLYIGAHPDDEIYASPLLAEACTERGARCHFVVAADAGSFGCLKTIGLRDPEECSRLRREEMRASVARFDGEVEFYGWPNSFFAHDGAGVDRVLRRWGRTQEGGEEALVARVYQTLTQTRPALVLTFDPRHGSTCHPEHRAIARLALRAVASLEEAERPQVWVEQVDNIRQRSAAVEAINMAWGVALWPDLPEPVVWHDANRVLASGRNGYDWLLDTVALHATQFPGFADAPRPSAPPEQRRVPWTAPPSEPGGDFCDALGLDYPTIERASTWHMMGLEPDSEIVELP